LRHRGEDLAKRVFDVLAAACALVVLAPVLLLIAAAVWMDSGSPVLFRQSRVGRDGKPFRLLKFRSMVVQAPGSGVNVSAVGDPRVTGIGRLLRESHLDELPQLFNVVRGDMSLVGPRPETPEFVNLYDADERRVLQLRPGIAGPSTLRFMNEAALLAGVDDPVGYYRKTLLHDRVRSDLEYLGRRSLRYDIGLLIRQFVLLLKRR
jgi:lipopolysaccharide/colanic/teichoic acid biosynthesis glycosyltransferase